MEKWKYPLGDSFSNRCDSFSERCDSELCLPARLLLPRLFPRLAFFLACLAFLLLWLQVSGAMMVST